MKVSSLYNNKYLKQYLFYLIPFFIPIYSNFVTWTIIIYFLIHLINFNYSLFQRLSASIKFFHPFFIFFFIEILFIRSLSNVDNALFDIQVKLSFLVMPLVFIIAIPLIIDIEASIHKLKKWFIWGCSISSSIFLLNAIIQYIYYKKILHYTDFVIWFHPSYYALYLNTAIVFLFTEYYKKNNTIFWLLFTILVTSSLLTSSKSGWISLILVSIVMFYKLFNIPFFIKSLLLIFIISTFVIIMNKLDNERIYYFKKSIENLLNQNQQESESSGYRIIIWQSCIDILKNEWILGTGTGSATETLNRYYKEKHLYHLFEKKLNAHNQFFQTFISLGIIGFLSLIYLLLYPIIFLKKRFYEYNLIIFIIILNFLTESMLETQAGSIYTGYILSLIYFHTQFLAFKELS